MPKWAKEHRTCSLTSARSRTPSAGISLFAKERTIGDKQAARGVKLMRDAKALGFRTDVELSFYGVGQAATGRHTNDQAQL